MSNFSEIFPIRETLLELEPEDVAMLLLQYLKGLTDSGQLIHRYNLLGHDSEIGHYAGNLRQQTLKVLSEGWNWLEGEGLIAFAPDDSSLHNYFVTRRGKKLRNSTDFAAFRLGTLLEPKSLDPTLALKVADLFTRGDYDTAIFQAYKVRVRKVCARRGQPIVDETIGINLMSEAFNAKKGHCAISNLSRPKGSRCVTSSFGAIGLFKNPSSHRDVNRNRRE
jgi:hypothetical protein